jgi:hypothetical protein
MIAPAQPSPEVQVREWTWKNTAMRRMTLAVCRLALGRGTGGSFSAMDLAEHGEEAHGGSGIAGTIFRQLSDVGIIAPVGVWVDGEFVQKYVRNACGNRIGVWRLAHPGLARALLAAHDSAPIVATQSEMVFGASGKIEVN